MSAGFYDGSNSKNDRKTTLSRKLGGLNYFGLIILVYPLVLDIDFLIRTVINIGDQIGFLIWK
jgi:hypothetical protein